MRKLILINHQAPGDIVMLTAAVRDLHLCYPNQFITDVRTKHPALWENNRYLTSLNEADKDVKTIQCHYPLIHKSNWLPYHFVHGFIEFLNEQLNLRIKPTAFKGDIHLSEKEKESKSQVQEITGENIPYWLIVSGGKYDFTIKWWDVKRYQQVVDYFQDRICFVQVGEDKHHHPLLKNVIDLRGKTDLRQLIRVVYHAQGVVTPVSLLMHLATAVETKRRMPKQRPCVVIAGGREPVQWEAYPNHQFIHTIGALSCCETGGCWKSRVKPLHDGNENDKPDKICVDVVGDLPRCMDMITADEVIRRIEIYLNHDKVKRFQTVIMKTNLIEQSKAESFKKKGLLRFFRFRVRRTSVIPNLQTSQEVAPLEITENVLPLAPVAIEKESLTTFQRLSNHNALVASEQYINSIPEYPEKYKGKGIVICAGGVRLFTSAWVCVNILRKLGCTLPIQLWHLGEREIDEQMKAIVKSLDVQCVDALEMRKKIPARILNGWELKAYALLHNQFEEVLLLDADNVPVVNPEFLFSLSQYTEAGAVFWPDLGRLQRDRMIWKLCGVSFRDEPEFESGQMLVNKEKCWKALKLTMWYNEHSDFYYQHIHGDKETFHLAFRKVGKDYAMPTHRVILHSGVMYQHDFNGNVIFQHRNGPKWNYHNGNPKLPGFRFQDECFEFVKQLREKWDGVIGIDFSRKREKLKAVIRLLTSQTYMYNRIGYDHRLMTFLSNGKIGAGKAGCEQMWDVNEDGGQIWLDIFSEQARTCRLKLGSDNIWHGQWLVHEKMKVELIPANERGDAIKNFKSRQDVEAAGKSQSCFYYDTLSGQHIIVGRMLGSFWLAAREDDRDISVHIMRDGYWEAWITLWVVRNVKPGTVCIDAGANCGYFTFLLARLGCKVIAVEANPELIPFLEKSAELNNCQKQVKIIHAAVVSKRGKAKLNLKESTLNSTVIDIPTRQSYEVKAITLDSIREEIGFVKMDIEGAEESAWLGMKKLKSKCVTLMEFVPDHYTERGRLFFDTMNETHHISYVDFSGNEQPLHSHDFFLPIQNRFGC